MAEMKGILAVIGTAIIYFSIGLYFSSGNTAIYLTSYLRAKSTSTATLSDSVWFLYAVGLSALLLPFGGWLDSKIGSRAVCIIGGLLQSAGIFATYFALNHSFILVLICYGGSFLLSCGVAYTAPLVEINKWFPEKKGLVTGIACASMAFAPTAWTPLITAYVNPLNIPADMKGYFTDTLVLERTKDSLIVQGLVTLFLFSIGTALLFPAPSAEDLDSVKKQQKASGNGETGKVVKLRFADGLTPSQAIKTFEFIILSIKIMLTELVFFYLLFVYKPFGQTFIKNDLMLSAIGACAGLSNCFCRLLMGYIKDLLSYKACCIPLSAMSTVLIASLPFSSMAHPLVYSITVVAAVGIIGSQYALMPSAVTDTFGEKYASMNIGLVYMSTVIADVGGALGSQYLTESLGWTGMIYAISFCSFLDFIATFALPSDPGQRLKDKLNADKIVTEILPSYQMNRNKGVKGSTPIVLPEAYLMRKESNPTKTSLNGKQLNC